MFWNDRVSKAHESSPAANQEERWIPGIPRDPEPGRLYAVMGQPDSGYGVGVVIRGADCNWRSNGIIAHYPLPLIMTQAEAMKLKRRGVFDF